MKYNFDAKGTVIVHRGAGDEKLRLTGTYFEYLEFSDQVLKDTAIGIFTGSAHGEVCIPSRAITMIEWRPNDG